MQCSRNFLSRIIWFCVLLLVPAVYGMEKETATDKKTDSPAVVEDDPAAVRINTPGADVYGRMESIIFPNVEFEDADLFSVVRYLNRAGKRYDPAKTGVGIVVAGLTKETAGKLPKITMHLSKIPMSEVMRYVCQCTGLKFKVDDGVVIIGTDIDEIQTGSFNIRGDLISDITGIKSDAGAKKKEQSITAQGAKTDFNSTFKNDSTGK
jgi:hypothetical protein